MSKASVLPVKNPNFASGFTNDPLVLTYATVTIVLCLKTLFMAYLTSRQRKKKMVVANPEDLYFKKGYVVKHDDPDVERMRMAHRNDLENIPIFLIVAFLYIAFNQPSESLCKTLLWTFTGARVLHSFIYTMVVIPQPARRFCYVIGLLVTLYMAMATLFKLAITQLIRSIFLF